MKRRKFLLTAVAAVLAAGPALALDLVEDIAAQLRKQGYTSITVTRTLLGRRRIFAQSSEYQREIIVNPRTGEILRDYWTLLPGVPANADDDMTIFRGPDSGDDDGGGDDNGGDDKEDDDKEDDHSDSSGSGSGGEDD